jgi:hypothetical protein
MDPEHPYDVKGESVVLDKSAMRSAELLEPFLLANSANRVILTDFCCMESYKGALEFNLPKSLAILERAAHQVVILKGTREIVSLSLRTDSGDTRVFVDPVQTAEFALFCRRVRLGLSGHAALRLQLEEHGQDANAYLKRLQAEAAQIAPAIRTIARELPSQTVKRLRRREEPTHDDIDIFIPAMLMLARDFLSGHPDIDHLPEPEQLPHTFILRYAVAAYLLALEWIRRGGIEGASPEALGNDVADMNYVAMATYFDGILTHDQKLSSIYAEARWYVSDVFSVKRG